MTTDLQTLALTPHWLDLVPSGTQSYPLVSTASPNTALNTSSASALGGTVTTTLLYSPGWYNTAYGWYCYPVTDHRPIKLGLSEVEKLRSAAKRDAKLKKILEKFTDQIEVVVDFK